MSNQRPPGQNRQKQTYSRPRSSQPVRASNPQRSPAPRRQKKKNSKSGAALLVSVLVVACFATVLAVVNTVMSQKDPTMEAASAVPMETGALDANGTAAAPEPLEQRIRFSAVGDNLIHDGIYLQAAARAGGAGYDFSYIYENVAEFFTNYDVNWINQETLVNNELDPSSYPTFSTPGELGQAAYDAGWRVFAMSNNHTYDKGTAGLQATMNYWNGMPEDVVTPGLFTGDDEQDIKLQEVNGMTLAYLSYTQYTNGIPTPADAPAWIIYTENREAMQRQVELARQKADVVLVGVHWGVEDSHEVTMDQRALAAEYVSWGADVVIGTHPHVIQPVEWITNEADGRQALVVYSLGNFISAQSKADNLIGMALTFDLVQMVNPDGGKVPVVIENVQAYPTVTHYDGGYQNIRNYMYSGYSEELAAGHGVRERFPGFTMEYIQQVAQSYIDPEFLVL